MLETFSNKELKKEQLHHLDRLSQRNYDTQFLVNCFFTLGFQSLLGQVNLQFNLFTFHFLLIHCKVGYSVAVQSLSSYLFLLVLLEKLAND